MLQLFLISEQSDSPVVLNYALGTPKTGSKMFDKPRVGEWMFEAAAGVIQKFDAF